MAGYKTAPVVPGLFLVDAWRCAEAAIPAGRGAGTIPHASKHGFDARIDYIHVGGSGPNGEGAISGVRLAGDCTVDGVWASDHAAVGADLAI